MFDDIWSILDASDVNTANLFEFYDWQEAIKTYRQPHRNNKPLLTFV